MILKDFEIAERLLEIQIRTWEQDEAHDPDIKMIYLDSLRRQLQFIQLLPEFEPVSNEAYAMKQTKFLRILQNSILGSIGYDMPAKMVVNIINERFEECISEIEHVNN